jgi:predicted RNA-binding Zn-ribbon protein involved in translation (DUF1610 family)
MEIVKGPTDLPRLPIDWWIGKTNSCGRCGTVVKLDASDKPSHYVWADAETVHFDCPSCGNGLCIRESREAKVRHRAVIECPVSEPPPVRSRGVLGILGWGSK